MEEINIPIPDVMFRDIVLDKARITISKYLGYANLIRDLNFYDDEKLFNDINSIYLTVNGDSDKILYISEILVYVGNLYKQHNSKPTPNHHDKAILKRIGNIQYVLHNEILGLGFNIDTNQFNMEETNTLKIEIGDVIDKLDKIAGGNEILFERIEELQEDFKSLLASIGLGKKPFYQRLVGITLGYLAEKGSDEVFETIKPLINEGGSEIINHIDKLIS